MGSLKRYDRGELKKPQRMDNGFLRVEGYLTRTGVFSYLNGDGTIRRELRLPEEVFKPEAMQSFALMPVTDEHPVDFLTAENAAQFSRGAVGENVNRDGDFVRSALMVTHADLVKKLENGEARELSCGYTCDLEFKAGAFEGERYDAIQRNIRGNHVAVVQRGRAGPAARVRMDAESAAMLLIAASAGDGAPIQDPPPISQEAQVAHKVRVDGIDVEVVTEQGAQLITKMQATHADAVKAKDTELEQAKKDLQTAIAKADAEAEKAKKLDADLKAAPEKVRAEITARVELESKARGILGKEVKFDGLTARQVKEKVLAKTSPDLKLDGKADAYVDARFDLALEQHDDQDDADNDEDPIDTARRATDGADDGNGDKKADADKAFEEMKKRHRDAWKKTDKTDAAA